MFYSVKDYIASLKKLGLKRGDNLFIHSNVAYFGPVNFKFNEKSINDFFVEPLLELIGQNGTVVVPTFTYSYINNLVFDPINSHSKMMGILSETIRKDINSYRSYEPIFSVSAIGKNAKYFTSNVSKYCFGKNSFWERFLKMDGKLLGFNYGVAATILHHFEWLLKVPYRNEKKFIGKSLIDGKLIENSAIYFCRNYNVSNNLRCFLGIEDLAKKKKIIKYSNLSRGYISLSDCQLLFKALAFAYSMDNYFLTVGRKIKIDDIV